MSFFYRLNAEKMLKKIGHLHPNVQLPADKSKWDIGHRCLNYIAKVLPKDKILLPSWYLLLLDQIKTGMRSDISAHEADLLRKANKLSWPEVEKQRDGSEASVFMIQKHGAANCGEFAEVTEAWLRYHGVNAQTASVFFMENGERVCPRHEFTLYTLPGESCETVQDIAAPHVRICDAWSGLCGSARDVLNAYCHMLVMKRQGQLSPVCGGLDVIVELNTVYEGEEKEYVVGKTVVPADGWKPVIVFNKNPECYVKNRSDMTVCPDVNTRFPASTFKKCCTWRRVRTPWENNRCNGRGERK